MAKLFKNELKRLMDEKGISVEKLAALTGFAVESCKRFVVGSKAPGAESQREMLSILDNYKNDETPDERCVCDTSEYVPKPQKLIVPVIRTRYDSAIESLEKAMSLLVAAQMDVAVCATKERLCSHTMYDLAGQISAYKHDVGSVNDRLKAMRMDVIDAII